MSEATRSAVHQHHALPLGRRRAEGEQRPSGPAARRRADGLRAVDATSSSTIHAIPHWFDRDRFVLSAGHGSMLLYSLLHLTGYDLSLDDLEQFPPVGQQDAGPSRARPHAGRRDHDRAARAGPRQRGRHGDRRGAAGRALQPARLRGRRPHHLRARQRRRPDGGRRRGGGLARRPPEARQADLPLRRQPRHAGRWHRHHVLGGSRPALRGLRLAHGGGRRRQRPRCDRRRAAGRARGDRAAVADPGPHPHRLRLAAQAGHASKRTARRSAPTRCA